MIVGEHGEGVEPEAATSSQRVLLLLHNFGTMSLLFFTQYMPDQD